MAILRLATSQPPQADYGSGTAVFTATAPTLLSIIAVNTSEDVAYTYIYVVPEDTEATPSEWGVIAYRLPISGNNIYETFRFAVNLSDTVYVAGSAGIAYYVQGVPQ